MIRQLVHPQVLSEGILQFTTVQSTLVPSHIPSSVPSFDKSHLTDSPPGILPYDVTSDLPRLSPLTLPIFGPPYIMISLLILLPYNFPPYLPRLDHYLDQQSDPSHDLILVNE